MAKGESLRVSGHGESGGEATDGHLSLIERSGREQIYVHDLKAAGLRRHRHHTRAHGQEVNETRLDEYLHWR